MFTNKLSIFKFSKYYYNIHSCYKYSTYTPNPIKTKLIFLLIQQYFTTKSSINLIEIVTLEMVLQKQISNDEVLSELCLHLSQLSYNTDQNTFHLGEGINS